MIFRFGKRYELPLLFQSIVMNLMMLLMIHLCVKVRNKTQIIKGPDRFFTGKANCVIYLPLMILLNILSESNKVIVSIIIYRF